MQQIKCHKNSKEILLLGRVASCATFVCIKGSTRGQCESFAIKPLKRTHALILLKKEHLEYGYYS